MAIRFSNASGNFSLPEAENVRIWIAEVVRRRGRQVGNINYMFCNDEYMLEANRRYLDHDTYTDIITFDYVAGSLISGDILLNVDRVRDNAVQFETSFENELRRVVIHGVLHLLGQGDKSEDEAAEMRRQEEQALQLWSDMFPVEHSL